MQRCLLAWRVASMRLFWVAYSVPIKYKPELGAGSGRAAPSRQGNARTTPVSWWHGMAMEPTYSCVNRRFRQHATNATLVQPKNSSIHPAQGNPNRADSTISTTSADLDPPEVRRWHASEEQLRDILNLSGEHQYRFPKAHATYVMSPQVTKH
ncbi:hypothetical protein B0T24DRAFT_67862 [Lasiosphaeria ovina]|uniref:Secreted protein n=1 Tax=Lasiosphaeria ovina TaxID=92902 RepID=A0AAE0NM58_9PEZI|nr:hypothetical protein B0T24DRAFT_67862 [Lasiosphaeria ovina]